MIPGGQALYGPKKNETTGSIWDQMKNLPLQARINAAATQAGKAVNAGISRPPVSSTPIVDPDVRRAQLAANYGTPNMPALDAVNTDPVAMAALPSSERGTTSTYPQASTAPSGPAVAVDSGGGATSVDTSPVGQGGDEVFDIPTESELALERLKIRLSNQLSRAAQNAESGLARLQANAQSDYEAGLRGLFNDYRNYRRSISGTGKGQSPRFTTAIKMALQAQADARQAMRDRQYAESAFDIIGGVRNIRDEASEYLTDEELDILTDVSGRNLSNISDSAVSSFFTRGARSN